METCSNKFANKNIVSHNYSDTFIGPPEFNDTQVETQSGKFDWGGLIDGIIDNSFSILDKYINGGNIPKTTVTTPVASQNDNTKLYLGIGAGLLLLIILLLVIKK